MVEIVAVTTDSYEASITITPKTFRADPLWREVIGSVGISRGAGRGGDGRVRPKLPMAHVAARATDR